MRYLNAGMLLPWFSLLLTLGSSQEHCKANDGKNGLAGMAGRDGRPGQKGEKGDSGLLTDTSVRGMKGESGARGIPGEMGIQGYPGEVGPNGPSGEPGPKGLPGDNSGSSKQYQSAFSVLRTDTTLPEYGKPVQFNKAHTNVNGHFSLHQSQFVCEVTGVYYFVFHSMSMGDLCLAIKNDVPNNDNNNLGFCDYNRNDKQVLSGGVVLELKKGNKVWLEAFKDDKRSTNFMSAEEGKSIVFSGFLIFQSS